MSGRFELYRDVRERFRFRLKADDGAIILTSDGFDQKAMALDAIVSVMKSAQEATIVDLTLQPEWSYELDEEPVYEAGDAYDYDEADEYSGKKKKKKKRRRKKGRKPDKNDGDGKEKGRKGRKGKKKKR